MTPLDEYVKPLDASADDAKVVEWITEQMQKEDRFLLAHADDGVIWGKSKDGEFQTGRKAAQHSAWSANISPELDGITLQQAFLFNAKNEIRLFRDELGNWQARQISSIEQDGKLSDDMIEESQILWGNDYHKDFPIQLDGFTHVRDKTQEGLDQILPIEINKDEIQARKCARLKLHHFVVCDEETGEARIGLSRLVEVYVGDAVEANHAAQA
jgi:CRISPR-associated protein (TIGR03984 family)